MNSGSTVRAWLFWFLLLGGVTLLLFRIRTQIDQSQVALTMLLCVLGGSVSGGRSLGLSLAVIGTALIDYYFQYPYGFLSVPKPLDLDVLLAFLATALVTTELLTRLREEAARAQARTHEVETLSRLGAETLRFASSNEAIDAIAALVRRETGATSCTIVPWDEHRRDGRSQLGNPQGIVAPGFDREMAALVARCTEDGRPVYLRTDASIAQHESPDIAEPSSSVLRTRAVSLPLIADGRIIGVLVAHAGAEMTLDGAKRRLLGALAYYAAIGLERMRLISAAAFSEALRESQRAKDEVFASVSHDLRTPLTTIKVLAQAGADAGVRSSLAIVEQADRLARLVGDLLDVSRMRAGAKRVTPELNTAEDLIGAALRRTEGILNGRTINVVIDYESPALVGRFDFVHTLRIVGNLLDNAIRYTPEGGVVELRGDRHDRWLTFSVADRGEGVPASERARIFDAFYRPAHTALDGGHAGLGLSIARSLAEAQDGTVEYEERPGGGSIFTVRLPAADVSEMTNTEVA